MKKFLLFVSIVFFSLFIVNNKVYAQEDFPSNLLRLSFNGYEYEQTHQYSYEYTVEYILEDYLVFELDEIDYYFVTRIDARFYKGYLNAFSSYEVIDIYTWSDITRGTLITLRVTVEKDVIERYGNPYNYQDVLPFFRDDTALYINYYIPDPNAYNMGYNNGYEAGYNIGYDDGLQVGEQVGYDSGYSDGYSNGFNNGYNEGYGDGVRAAEPQAYQRGYDDGYEDASNTAVNKFTSNLHVWLVPAIIIVVIAGIFVGYRRERYGGE